MSPPVVWTTPVGLPVVPLVYNMNKGCSASRGCAGWSPDILATISCHQTSRPATIGTASPVRLYTTAFRMDGVLASDSSTFFLRVLTAPCRYDPLAVIHSIASESYM